MFTVELSDAKYDVSFMHFEDRKMRKATRCLISKIQETKLSDGTNVYIPYYEGETYCSKGDNFCRAVGRKLSFSRAVAFLDRDDRTKLWSEYWKHNRKI